MSTNEETKSKQKRASVCESPYTYITDRCLRDIKLWAQNRSNHLDLCVKRMYNMVENYR